MGGSSGRGGGRDGERRPETWSGTKLNSIENSTSSSLMKASVSAEGAACPFRIIQQAPDMDGRCQNLHPTPINQLNLKWDSTIFNPHPRLLHFWHIWSQEELLVNSEWSVPKWAWRTDFVFPEVQMVVHTLAGDWLDKPPLTPTPPMNVVQRASDESIHWTCLRGPSLTKVQAKKRTYLISLFLVHRGNDKKWPPSWIRWKTPLWHPTRKWESRFYLKAENKAMVTILTLAFIMESRSVPNEFD